MRKVKEVMKEIEDMKEASKIIGDIANKMIDDYDVKEYMNKTFGVQTGNLKDIANKIYLQAHRLQNKLEEY